MTAKKTIAPKVQKVGLFTTEMFTAIQANMKKNGQGVGSKYDKIKLLGSISINDASCVGVEEKETGDGRTFYILAFVNPANTKEKLSLPISGSEDSESFEFWATKANVTFSVNGNEIKKGTEKVRLYSVD